MDFLNQIVIHKLWGEGTVTRHDHTGLYVTFGNEEEDVSRTNEKV